MEVWQSIREFYSAYPAQCRRHGVAVLLLVAAMGTDRWLLAGLIFGGMVTMLAYDLWGEPWRKRGEKTFKTLMRK